MSGGDPRAGEGPRQLGAEEPQGLLRATPAAQGAVIAVCAKRQRRCPELLAIREEALEEWCRAETFPAVCAAWGRLGGLTTLHRLGAEHFRELGRRSALARRRTVS